MQGGARNSDAWPGECSPGHAQPRAPAPLMRQGAGRTARQARRASGRRHAWAALLSGRLSIMLLLMALMGLRAIIPNGYMIDAAAARAGHYALMPCPATGWRWPVEAPAAPHHDMPHGEHHARAADGHESDIEHISVDCPTGIMLSQAVAPALWWPPVLALVPAWARPLPRAVPPRIAYGPVCGPPVGAQAPPALS
ncbi:hypothetical protein [Kerstersia sp.]|uniref:hypothetical protein n=1 Tax=Kerstersia sp. TaxID=1930783 RepID=UPI003F8F2884